MLIEQMVLFLYVNEFLAESMIFVFPGSRAFLGPLN